MDTSPGLMDRLTGESTNTVGNTEWACSCSPQENITKGSGCMEGSMGKEP